MAIFRFKPEYAGLSVDGSLAYGLSRTFDYSTPYSPGGGYVSTEDTELIVAIREQIAGNAAFPFEETIEYVFGSPTPLGSFGQRFASRVERRVM